jgi:hypothetical protein
MLDKFGIIGIVGVLVMLGGLSLIAFVNPLIAGGLVLVLVGVGLIVRGLISSVMSAMGMGGMFEL